MKKLLAVLIIFVAIIGLVLFNQRKSSEQTDKPIVKIGVTLPLSGNLAFVGNAAKAGLEMSLAEEKQKGLRYDYKLVLEDNEGNVARTASTTQKLISIDKTNAILSIWNFRRGCCNP